jgi:hypothetical protein
MNVDQILETMNRCDAAFILIGGMNFMLRHVPVLTYSASSNIRKSSKRIQCSASGGPL